MYTRSDTIMGNIFLDTNCTVASCGNLRNYAHWLVTAVTLPKAVTEYKITMIVEYNIFHCIKFLFSHMCSIYTQFDYLPVSNSFALDSGYRLEISLTVVTSAST
jgi:hypothetical protein